MIVETKSLQHRLERSLKIEEWYQWWPEKEDIHCLILSSYAYGASPTRTLCPSACHMQLWIYLTRTSFAHTATGAYTCHPIKRVQDVTQAAYTNATFSCQVPKGCNLAGWQLPTQNPEDCQGVDPHNNTIIYDPELISDGNGGSIGRRTILACPEFNRSSITCLIFCPNETQTLCNETAYLYVQGTWLPAKCIANVPMFSPFQSTQDDICKWVGGTPLSWTW